jgi:hypothetical protein
MSRCLASGKAKTTFAFLPLVNLQVRWRLSQNPKTSSSPLRKTKSAVWKDAFWFDPSLFLLLRINPDPAEIKHCSDKISGKFLDQGENLPF